MTRICAALVVATLLLGACTSEDDLTGSTRPAPETASPDADDVRAIAIYSAVIRRLVTKDNTFGGRGVPFDRLYVVDRSITRPGREPIATAVQDGIRQSLSDLPPLDFIAAQDEVVVEEDGCAQVENNGAAITLGTIPDGTGKVNVRVGMFVACLAGTTLTYVVKGAGDEWKVTGTTGPIGIS